MRQLLETDTAEKQREMIKSHTYTSASVFTNIIFHLGIKVLSYYVPVVTAVSATDTVDRESYKEHFYYSAPFDTRNLHCRVTKYIQACNNTV